MIIGLIICFIYISSILMCSAIFIERYVEPTPITIFIVLCPIINTIYCIYRITSLNGNWKNWTKNL